MINALHAIRFSGKLSHLLHSFAAASEELALSVIRAKLWKTCASDSLSVKGLYFCMGGSLNSRTARYPAAQIETNTRSPEILLTMQASTDRTSSSVAQAHSITVILSWRALTKDITLPIWHSVSIRRLVVCFFSMRDPKLTFR